VKAATWSSRKWAWVAEAAGPDTVVLRCSFGRHRESALLQRDDTDLVRLAVDELADAVGLRGQVSDALVTRWGGGLPQYAVGHAGRVERVRQAVADIQGLEVCGAPYEGIGIAACVADAQRAADRLLTGLQASQDRRTEQATMDS
jgi:oxygen-dependent protoporphyrinogen oxidase